MRLLKCGVIGQIVGAVSGGLAAPAALHASHDRATEACAPNECLAIDRHVGTPLSHPATPRAVMISSAFASERLRLRDRTPCRTIPDIRAREFARPAAVVASARVELRG